MRVRPTELGVKGLLLLAALELAFLATSYSNLFFLLIAFCCVLGIVGLAGAIANVHGVDVRSIVVPLAAAGAAREVEISIGVGGRRRFDLAFTLTDGRDRLELGWLPVASGSAVHRFEVPERARGVFRPRSLLVQTRYPFGLFQSTRRLAVDTDVVTYPSPSFASAAAGSGAAGEVALAGAPSTSVATLREFRGGDSLASVHWKATARRGTPIVKEREVDDGSLVDVVLDRRCDAVALEKALSTAAAFVLAARSGGPPLLLRSQDYQIEVSAHGDTATTVLRWLASALPLARDAAEPPPHRVDSIRLPAPERSAR